MDSFPRILPKYRKYFWIAELCVAFCAALLTVGCQGEDPQHYLAEGKLLLEQGDYESARVQFRNALQLDPKIADAYYYLALVDEHRQDWGGMFSKLQETLALDPNHLKTQIRLAQLYLSARQFKEASEYIHSALQISPYDATVILVSASIKFRQGQLQEAYQEVERVLAAEPFLADAIGLQVNILDSMGNYDDAVSLASKGVAHNPDDAELMLQKIHLEEEHDQFEAAQTDYQALITRFPDTPRYRLALAELLRRRNDTLGAEQLIQEAIKRYPDEIAYKYKLVDIYEQRDSELAEQTLRGFISAYPTDLELKFRLAELFVAQQRLGDAEKLLQSIVDSEVDDKKTIKADIKLAEIALMQKRLTRVEQLAEEILKLDVNQSDALLLRAGMRLNRLDADGAISDLRVVLRDRPYLEQAMLLISQANSAKGEAEVAESHLRKILDFNPNSINALIPLANEMLKRGDLARAEEMTIKEAALNPGQKAPLEMLIQLKELRKDWNGAAKTLDELKKIPDAEETAQYWAAHLDSAQGKTDVAIKGYQALLAQNIDHTQALMDLAQLYEANGRRSDLIAYLQELLTQKPESVSVLSVLAATYILDQRWAEGESKVRQAAEFAPSDVGLKLKLIDIIEFQDVGRAETTLKGYIKNEPNDARLVFRLTRYYQEHKRIPEAEAVLTEFAENNRGTRNAVNARLQLAELAWIRQDLREAKTRVNQLLSSEPRNVDALMLRAVLSLAEKAYPAVFADLYQVLDIRPDSEQALALMAQAYQEQGQIQNVEETWRRVLVAHPGNMPGLRFLIEKYVANDDWQQAVLYIDRAIKANPGNPRYLELKFQFNISRQDWRGAEDVINELKKWPQAGELILLWHANLAMQQGDYQRAIKYYTDLMQTMPSSVEVLVSAVQAYQKAKQPNELFLFLKSVIQRSPGFDEAYRLLARAYATEGDWAAAEKLLRDKLARTPADGRTWELLANLYVSQDKSAEADETFLAGLSATHDDIHLMNAQAVFHIVRREFDKAISIYEDILVKYPDNVTAANNLAELLVTHRSDDKQALDRAVELVERFRNANDPSLLDTYAWVHVKTDDVTNALPALQRAVDKAPENQTIRYHLAEAYARLGEKNSAIVHLRQVLNKKAGKDFMELEAARALFNQLQ